MLKETDDEHGLSMPELIERLQEYGISAERKAIYDDLETLKDYGLDIVTRRAARTEYAVGNRQFEVPELLLLANAVQSSRFLTKTKSEKLIHKLQEFASVHHKKEFEKSLHVEGRVKMINESVYYNIDALQAAMRNKRKITFRYYEYGLDKKQVLRREGKQYKENPLDLIYKDEYYYLTTYNDKYEKFLCYRVDRMVQVKEVNEPITRGDAIRNYDIQELLARSFGMFRGEAVSAVLVVNEQRLIGAIIDRFGKEVLIYQTDETSARVHVNILKSDVFFGWLAQFGIGITIESPPTLAREYKEHLERIAQVYAAE